jgi:hypothetical protein
LQKKQAQHKNYKNNGSLRIFGLACPRTVYTLSQPARHNWAHAVAQWLCETGEVASQLTPGRENPRKICIKSKHSTKTTKTTAVSEYLDWPALEQSIHCLSQPGTTGPTQWLCETGEVASQLTPGRENPRENFHNKHAQKKTTKTTTV